MSGGYDAWRRKQADEVDMSMSAVDAMAEAMAQQIEAEEDRTMPFYDWAARIPEPKTGTLSFQRFPFQEELYREAAGDYEMCVKKCLHPDTRVLTADLRWVRIDDLEVGDRLVACDEEPQGTRRAYRAATVEARWDTEQEEVELRMVDGRIVRATPNHRLLVRRGRRQLWREVRDLRPGDCLRHVTTPFPERDHEDAWMAGIIDGEGWVARRKAGCEVVITQRPGPVLDAVRNYLLRRGYKFRESLEPRPNGKSVGRISISATGEVMRLLGATRPVRSWGEWWEGVAFGGQGNAWTPIESIATGAVRRMVDLQTSTGTYIAEGFVSHNSTQVGVSAYLVRWTMYWADVRGLTALYVFPKTTQLLDFSDARVRPLVLGSEYLRKRVPALHVQNKGLKQIGLGYVYYRGSESTHGLESVDADALALDEYDILTPSNIPVAERRVSGSMHPMIRRVGVPIYPDWGVSKKYDASDMRRWMVKCSHCGEWQHLTFWDNVDQEKAIRVCVKCRKSIEDDIAKGQWAAEFPSRDVRGYHIPRLIVPGLAPAGLDLKAIIANSKKRSGPEVRNFYNRDLGEPFMEEGGRLSREDIAATTREFGMSSSYSGPELVTMGVDVASKRDLNVRISLHNLRDRTKGALWIGVVPSFDDVVRLMRQYDVKMCCIDHMPEYRQARNVAEMFPGRVYLVKYVTTAQVINVDEELREVGIRRTETIDAVVQMIREQRNHLPENLPDEYVEQMTAPLRIVEKDELDRVKVKWTKPDENDKDDYMHAEAYDLIAGEMWKIRQEVAEAEREVLTPLDEMMQFQRTDIGDWQAGDGEYSEGRRIALEDGFVEHDPDDYSPGFGGDYW